MYIERETDKKRETYLTRKNPIQDWNRHSVAAAFRLLKDVQGSYGNSALLSKSIGRLPSY